MRAGHGAHVRLVLLTVYVPAGQEPQTVAPLGEFEPAWQAAHVLEADAPTLVEKVLAAQGVQVRSASLKVYVPAGQRVQAEAFTSEYEPAGQTVHGEAVMVAVS